jgi:CRISPR/Cas system CSM-associated protein Csm3 (group 7 of RAMP superfamily)
LPKEAQARKERHAQGVAGSFLKLNFTLTFDDFFLSHDPIAGLISGFDHAPLLEFMDAPGKVGLPLLSGSSLRGVLRSHAEKIARTLATNHWVEKSANIAGARDNFLQNCPACDVLARKEDALASCDVRLTLPDQKETPEEALCWSCRLFGSQRRGSRLWIRDAAVQADSLSGKDWKAQDFLAIDRFTGGGLHGAKFDAAPLSRLSFAGEIVLHDPADWELGWLSLLLRDLADGRLTVGFGKAKGYGRVKAKGVVWTVGYLHEEDGKQFGLVETETVNAPLDGIYRASQHHAETGSWLPAGWLERAQTWVDQFNQVIVQTDQKDEHWQPFEQDSFFTKEDEPDFMALYGISRAEVTHDK